MPSSKYPKLREKTPTNNPIKIALTEIREKFMPKGGKSDILKFRI